MHEALDRIALALKITQYNLEEQAKKIGPKNKRQGLALMKEAIQYERLRNRIKKGLVEIRETHVKGN